MTAGAQGTASASAKTIQSTAQPIPFRPEARGSESSAADILLTLVLLLGTFVALLWFARKKGWLDRWIVAPAARTLPDGGLRLEQSLRLSQKSTLYRVCDADVRYLIVESSGTAQVMRVEPAQERNAND